MSKKLTQTAVINIAFQCNAMFIITAELCYFLNQTLMAQEQVFIRKWLLLCSVSEQSVLLVQ